MILLSAGHNSDKRGACNGDYCEHENATKWVNYIQKLIKPFILTKIVPSGRLVDKVGYINSIQECDIAVEIHFNSNVNAKGSESLYHPNSKKGKELAENIQDEFENANIFQPNRGVKEGWYKMDHPDVIDYNGDVKGDEVIDYFLRRTRPVAVVIEPDFISQKDRIEEDMELGCRAIADALIKFYHRHYKHD